MKSLRDQIADALLNADAWAQLERRDDRDRFADAVMAAVVQPELDRQAAAFNAAIASTASDAMEHRLCNMTLMGVVQRAEQAEARLAELEGALNWLTSCLNCSSLLDSSYADYVRAEQAEAERDQLRTDLREAADDAAGHRQGRHRRPPGTGTALPRRPEPLPMDQVHGTTRPARLQPRHTHPPHPRGPRPGADVIHQSLECEGIVRDLECEDCDDAACEHECHFDREETPRHDPA